MRLFLMLFLGLGIFSVAQADITCRAMEGSQGTIEITASGLTFAGMSGLGIPDQATCSSSNAETWELTPLHISSTCKVSSSEHKTLPLAISAASGHLTITSDGGPVFLGSCQ